MDVSKMLSGSQLVAKGASKKVDGQLPEVGLKDVSPNGSWLEKKQVQSALEARKHLVAVERIEKSGSLNYAEWRDDLKVAEVTKKRGGYWQYIGHQRNNFLYLLPEETLFLMETNRLLLRHNGVTVSLQKAYSLCLKEISIIEYKVYASLGRLEYRVSRHKGPTPDKNDEQNANKETASTVMEQDPEIDHSVSMNIEHTNSASTMAVNNSENDTNNATNKILQNSILVADKNVILSKSGTTEDGNIKNTGKNINSTTTNNNSATKALKQNKEKTVPTIEVTSNKSDSSNVVTVSSMDIDNNANEVTTTVYSIDEFGVIRLFEKENFMETDADCYVVDVDSTDPANIGASTNDSFQPELRHCDDRIKKLTEIKNNCERNNQALDSLLDFHKILEIKVNAPDEKYLPRNIFLNRTEYTLNIEVLRTQNASNVNDETDSTRSPTPFINTDVQRLTDTHHTTFNTPHSYQNTHYNFNTQASYQNTQYNTYNTPPRYQYANNTHNTFHPRRGYRNFRQRGRFNPRMINYSHLYRPMSNFSRPRYHSNSFIRQQYRFSNVNMPRQNMYNQSSEAIKKYHYDMIVNIATRFKEGLALPAQVRALYTLLNTFNLRYNMRICITPSFDVVGTPETAPVLNDAENVITLKDEPKRKKRRLKDDMAKYNNNLEKLKELAAKLKVLHEKNLAVSRHRRVFSNAMKTFNKSFSADIHMDSNFAIVDRKTVVLDSSSDSDAVIVEDNEKPKKRKKLRNPYSILKQLGKDVNVGASTSRMPVLRTLSLNVMRDNTYPNTTKANNAKSSTKIEDRDQDLLKSLYKSRYADNDEFNDIGFSGPKVCSRVNAHLDSLCSQIDCLDVLKNSLDEFKDWTEIKLAILKYIRASLNIQKHQVEALSNDLFTTESRMQPILPPDCTDLKSALDHLAIIQTNKEIPVKTSLRVHFDVCNRHVHFKKSDPPKPNFRVVCYEESARFPSTEDVVALQSKYHDDVPLVFAFVGHSSSISYLQINSADMPVFIPCNDLSCE